jgi:tetratricopeptide (TPR) repeat protein
MAIQRAAEYVASRTGEGPGPRIAIHVGQFTVGRLPDATQIDAEGKREAWPILEALAARAEPGTTLVSEAAAAFLRRQFDLVVPEDRPAAGGEGFYRLAGRERRPFGPGQRVSEFVGRMRELELLRTLLDSAVERRGQIVGIVGEPGIGKSRLLHEFRQRVRDEPVTCLEAHCLEYGSTMPYLPILDILRQNCRIVESDLPAAIVEKVRSALQEVGLDPEAETPYLLHLLGLEEGTRALSGLNPELVRSRGVETLRQLALRGSRRRPLVLVIEDLHWMDTASRDVVASLVESLPGAPILFVATYRPGFRPAWMERSYATQVSLQPLTPPESRSVVRSVLGGEALDEGLIDLILARAEGNPFFLEELARTVREQGVGASGRPVAVSVPETVEAALLARIDRLPLADKRLIQAAAVIGRSVPLPVLQAIADLGDDRLRHGLLRLQAAEFVYESTLGTELDYTFKHALTHEVAYGSLLEAERRTLHVRIVAAIERIYADRLVEQTERLAYHALRGHEWGKALGYLRLAGSRAALRSAHREGVAYLEQALVALGRLPESRETLAQAIDLRFELRTTLAPLGEHERTYEHLREAEPLARALGDPRRLARVQAYLTDYFRQVGEGERAVESGQRALAMADALGDFPLRVAATLYLTQAHFDLGRYRSGSTLVRQVIDGLAGERSRERLGLPYIPAVHARTFLIVSLAELGEFGEALAQGEEALQLAEAVDHPFSLASACSGLGRVQLRSGDLPGAIRVLERGLEVSRAWSIRVMFTNLAADLGSAYAQAGRLSEGLPLLEQAVEQHAAMRRTAGHAIRLTSLGEAYLLAGRTGEAARLAERAGQLAERHAERGNQAYALRLAGDIAARVGGSRSETAEGAYQKAIALAEELGMTPLLAHGHLGLGRLYRRAGDHGAAEPHLRRAIALYEAMGTRGWLGQAEAESRGLD